jgi:hypothetical protein
LVEGRSLVGGADGIGQLRRVVAVLARLLRDRQPQQLTDLQPGRVADRPRLSSRSAGLGAGLVCCERSGGASAWAFSSGVGRGAVRGPSAPRGVSGIGGSPRWLVVRWCRGRQLALWTRDAGEGWACLRPICVRLRARPARHRYFARGGPVFGHRASLNRPTPRSPPWREVRVGLGSTMEPKTPRTCGAWGAGRLVVNY